MAKSNRQRQKEHRDKKRAEDPVSYKKKQAKIKRDKYVPIALRNKKEQKKARKKSAASSKKHRRTSKENPHEPQSSKVNRGKNATRKRTSKATSKLRRELESAEEARLKAEKKADALRKRLERLEKKTEKEKEEKRKAQNTPDKKAKRCMLQEGLSPKKHSKLFKELLFFYTLVGQIRDRNTKRKSLTKRSLERNLAGKLMRKYRLLGHLAKHTGLNRNNLSLKKLSRKKKARLVEERAEKRAKVVSFYLRDDVSQPMPGERDFVRIDKDTKIQARVLVDYQKINFLKFQAENPFVVVSSSVFYSWRPKYVLLSRSRAFETCLCTYHQNMELKLHALGINESADYLVKTKTNREILQMTSAQHLIYYEEWVKIPEKGTERIEKSSPIVPFMRQLESHLDEFREHVFRVNAQYTAVRMLKETIKPSEVIVQMDFAQNMTLEPQKAVQSAYWGQGQITLHPTVWYMKETPDALKHETHVYISDSTAHNTSAVYAIMKKLNESLPEHIDTIHYVTDSPPSQYRNRAMFHLVGNHEMLFGRKATWTYLEVSHGKGPCDGAGGTCKRQLREGIKTEKVRIRNASEAVSFMKKKPGCSMHFHLYSPEEVEKAGREVLDMDAQAIPSIMKLHAVKSMANGGQVSVRKTSCFCPGCKAGTNGCAGWSIIKIKDERKRPRIVRVNVRKGQFVSFTTKQGFAYGKIVQEFTKKVEILKMLVCSFNSALLRLPRAGEDKTIITVAHNSLLCNIKVQEQQTGPVRGTYRLLDGEEDKVKCLQKKKNSQKSQNEQ